MEVKEIINQISQNKGVSEIFIILIFLLFFSYVSFWIVKKVIPWVDILVKKIESPFVLILWGERILQKLPFLVSSLGVYLIIKHLDLSSGLFIFVEEVSFILLGLFFTMTINSMITNVTQLEKIKKLPNYLGVKSVLEGIKLFLYFVLAILIFARLTNQSPTSLLSALGAATAILLLVFRDSILGLAAGVQLSANNMIKIGDWVEIPSHQVSGSIIEISLTSVKIENWDKSVSNLPSYVLVQNSFKNWQGMISLGARRLKRSIYIDVNSIRFLKANEIEKVASTSFFKKNLANRDRKNITTIELFRVYVREYLLAHPSINNDQTLMVRQLESTPKGVPLEIYAFTNTAEWVPYENTQTEIFEHLFAKAKDFNLKVFQDPSGDDFRNILRK